MRFDVLTLFPEMFGAVLNESIIGRAQKNNIIEINAVNIRDFSADKHGKVDDYPYGGGSGMIMMAQPIFDAYISVTEKALDKPKVVYMSPQGKLLNQQIIKGLSKHEHLVIICGHYEGIDQRIIDKIVDEEISIGDYVLTGGELPAMVLIDAVSRILPGVLSGEAAYKDESHFNGLLEYPQYTRPNEFINIKVPEVLLSGHHSNITRWRRQQSLKNTSEKRPDMFKKYTLTDEESKLLEEAAED